MRVMFLSQAARVEDQPDFHASFLKALGDKCYRNLPYQGAYAEGGWPLLEKKVLELNEAFRPDVVFFQFFHAPENVHPKSLIRRVKTSANRPLIFGSMGDLFDTGLFSFLGRPLPPSIRELAAEADALFVTAMGRTARELVAKHGARNLVFLPNAYCPEHFPFAAGAAEKVYEVLMLGRQMRIVGRRPLVNIPTAIKRRFVVKSLTRAFRKRFAVYGAGWRGASAHAGVPFKEQVSLFRKSQIVVDAPPRVSEELYSSDRVYFVAGSGASLVMPYTPKFELLLEPDVHVHFVSHLRDIVSVCRRVLDLPADVRAENARRTIAYICARNLIAHRVDTILSVAEAIRGHREGVLTCEEARRHLRLCHFRPDVSEEEIRSCATANWKGWVA